jgi:hypothetical protein
MKWKLTSGKEISFNPANYRLKDWEKAPSGPQLKVQKFMYPYWKHDIVLTEMVLPKSGKKRYDLVNLSKKVIIETSPDSVHLEFNEFFHKSRAGYLKKIKADYEKMELAELNGFKFIELNDEHLENLTKKMFKEVFDLNL